MDIPYFPLVATRWCRGWLSKEPDARSLLAEDHTWGGVEDKHSRSTKRVVQHAHKVLPRHSSKPNISIGQGLDTWHDAAGGVRTCGGLARPPSDGERIFGRRSVAFGSGDWDAWSLLCVQRGQACGWARMGKWTMGGWIDGCEGTAMWMD
eukprot:350747-Chlamydomonas_euryale.AAC.13